MNDKYFATLWCALNCDDPKLTYRVQVIIERYIGTKAALRQWEELDASQANIEKAVAEIEKKLGISKGK